jgi:hypothetical protein
MGFFTPDVARMAGPGGDVVAVNIEEQLRLDDPEAGFLDGVRHGGRVLRRLVRLRRGPQGAGSS